MIGTIYAMKAMMRFSMAVVGCPVRVETTPASREVIKAELNGVKLVLFPSEQEETLYIQAYDYGQMHATIYTPQGNGAVTVTSIEGPVAMHGVYELRIGPAGDVETDRSSNETTFWSIDQSRLL